MRGIQFLFQIGSIRSYTPIKMRLIKMFLFQIGSIRRLKFAKHVILRDEMFLFQIGSIRSHRLYQTVQFPPSDCFYSKLVRLEAY